MLLRVAAGICFGYMVWYFWSERGRLMEIDAPIVGHLRPWMVIIGVVISGLISALLIVGAWTQGVAILAVLVVLKQLVFFRRYQSVFPFGRSTYWLLLCICLMLVVTGAGAFAFDLPL